MSVNRGHHTCIIYKSIWTPFIGEELVVEAEESNEHAVAVMKDSCVVGHVLRCSLMVLVSSAVLQESESLESATSR